MKYSIDKVNSWNGWDPLKQVILGNAFTPEFFEDIEDSKTRDLIQQLMYETNEDLDNIQKTLEDLGVDVVRLPHNTLTTGEKITDYANTFSEYTTWLREYDKMYLTDLWAVGLPKPMICPRDYFITMGDKVMSTLPMFNNKSLNLFNPDVYDESVRSEFLNDDNSFNWKLGPLKLSIEYLEESFEGFERDWLNHNSVEKYKNNNDWRDMVHQTWGFWAPSITRFGDTLVVDTNDYTNLSQVMLRKFPKFKNAAVTIGGHNDSTFCPIKPGHVFITRWADPEELAIALPGWDIHIINNFDAGIPNETHDAWVNEWNQVKRATDGRWWTESGMDHKVYTDFVDQWLNKWVGYAEETIFEVNMLSVNPNTVLCLNYQKELHDKIRSIGIEPIYSRFRHRQFWDGGLHCLTLDTVREGGQNNYMNL